MTDSTNDLTPSRVAWFAVALYWLLACGLAWLVQLPLWLGDGLASPLFLPLTTAMMATPTIAALIVTFAVVKPKHKARYLGLSPFPVARSIVVILVWPVLWLAVVVGAYALAVALGWAEPDLSLSRVPAVASGQLSPTLLTLLSLVWLPISVVLAALPALGEEIGWRGFLSTALSPLGFWRAALLNGVLWGLWHAPIILLGYNFARTDAVGLVFMCVFCILSGIVLQAARYWCRNVWVAGVGHGAVNATAALALPYLKDFEPALGSSVGLAGWLVMGLLVAVVAGLGFTGRRLPSPLVPAPTPRPNTARSDYHQAHE